MEKIYDGRTLSLIGSTGGQSGRDWGWARSWAFLSRKKAFSDPQNLVSCYYMHAIPPQPEEVFCDHQNKPRAFFQLDFSLPQRFDDLRILSPRSEETIPMAQGLPQFYSGTSTLALVARVSAFTAGMVYGNMKLKYLKGRDISSIGYSISTAMVAFRSHTHAQPMNEKTYLRWQRNTVEGLGHLKTLSSDVNDVFIRVVLLPFFIISRQAR
ncbi:hypothetical protein Cgig2_032578 [Carnegiea gigantea]|uniref:Uncharacterized protein n=1 Tax=Carnegiea gigantea TaxID=171969 RepID=A0A9Q1KWR5_9CARY|nr:hypothetical protein Cgig2_032578 [Carnegiea gigantea]